MATKPAPSNINASMHGAHYISGLYAVTPDEPNTAILCKKVEAALQGGASLVQYRNKAADSDLRLQQASALLVLCRAYNVPLLINDHLDLCVQIGADGVHLGGMDGEISAARRLLGADKIIGASCYNRIELAEKAQAEGASYVAFGACFNTSTKPNAVNAPLSLFVQAKQKTNIPLVAIGGITLENAQQVARADVDAIAVVSALFSSEDITKTSQQFTLLFKTTS